MQNLYIVPECKVINHYSRSRCLCNRTREHPQYFWLPPPLFEDDLRKGRRRCTCTLWAASFRSMHAPSSDRVRECRGMSRWFFTVMEMWAPKHHRPPLFIWRGRSEAATIGQLRLLIMAWNDRSNPFFFSWKLPDFDFILVFIFSGNGGLIKKITSIFFPLIIRVP
jgi:hypothetical protein